MNGARRMPFVIAFAASLTLHLAVLLSPGWSLPLDDEPEADKLDATLLTPSRAAAGSAAVAAPFPRRSRPGKPAPASPAAPVAEVPADAAALAEPAPAPAGTIPSAPDVTAAAEAAEPVPPPPAAAPPAPSFAARWPRTGRIVFEVMREDGFVIGRSEHRWSHDGKDYTLRAVTETVGLAALFRPATVVQESRGGFDADGLRPFEFDARREGRNKDSARFDSAEGRILFGSGQSAAYVAAAQDMLSLFYQLGAIAFDAPQFVITVATGRKVARLAVAADAASELETPLGPRAVRHLRITGTAREDATEIWLDADTHLPLKIRHRDRKGEVFDQIATTIELEKPE